MGFRTNKQVIVIGAGLGGLSAAIRLAAAGYYVTVIEQQDSVGGKLQRIKLGDYSFDRGPSTITMRHAFERVFRAAGKQIEDYVTFYRLDEGTRNIFADGNTVDFTSNIEKVESQIAAYSPSDARQYRLFMKESALLYECAEKHFMNRLLLGWRDKADPRLLKALLRVRPFTTLNSLLLRYFKHPNTLALFGRYATYVGSEPMRAPAIFGMLPHLESALGVYGVRGGTYAIVEGFKRLAVELGVDIRTSVKVKRIVTHGGRVSGVETDQGDLAAEFVLANGDVLAMNRELLQEQARPNMRDAKINSYEPSLSGFVLLAGIRQQYEQLLHHTVFFPEHYGSEFDDIFRNHRAALDPAIYICNSSRSEPGMSPSGASNLFILANAPYLSNSWEWGEQQDAYSELLMEKLEQRGMTGLKSNVEAHTIYTPEQLRRDTSTYRGAIYGISSNSAGQTFFRPSNRSRIKGLWFVGGTTHPGGGTPMVTLSGQLVAEAIIDAL
ncbi:phytoene desaturase family protein [Paenibacillus radicis (ex Gao et al. 2016)]|uniref:4,4'-diaponeurosporene oxygenase n=1 Tax=Paenibacillus radicis (ex Gao et al. 2016) TaxID=1737354 RepID=A0A917H6T5_9BACL|nr:phytoene desaturase family protein [Paenibacillus radicis (ex Gao et al. 2016)]GGG68908.1 phytoene desaturase [Paenibacillus radicis (ex Gao et al. 2016)]